MSLSASLRFTLAKHGCTGGRAERGAWEQSAEGKQLLGEEFLPPSRAGVEAGRFCLCGAEAACSSLSSPVPRSAACLPADCISVLSFLLPKTFPGVLLPSHSAAPCTFASLRLTLVHCRRGTQGWAVPLPWLGAHLLPGSKWLSRCQKCFG